MEKKILLILLSFILAISIFSGCSDNSNKNDTTDLSPKKSDVTYPMKVTDSSGKSLTIKSKPENIASISLCTDEILLSIADKKNITALSSLSTDKGISCVAKEAADIENKLSGDAEKIIAASPDIIFVPDWSDASLISQLEDSGIIVYIYMTPSTIKEVKELIQNISSVIDEKEKGTNLISWMDEVTIKIDENLKNLEDSEKVSVMSLDGNNLNTYGKNTSFDEICKKAHVINSVSEVGIESYKELNKEKIIELNPELIIFPSWSYDNLDMDKEVETFCSDKSLKNVMAVKNDNVLTLKSKYITTVSQNIVLGVEEVAKNAYPKYFKE